MLYYSSYKPAAVCFPHQLEQSITVCSHRNKSKAAAFWLRSLAFTIYPAEQQDAQHCIAHVSRGSWGRRWRGMEWNRVRFFCLFMNKRPWTTSHGTLKALERVDDRGSSHKPPQSCAHLWRTPPAIQRAEPFWQICFFFKSSAPPYRVATLLSSWAKTSRCQGIKLTRPHDLRCSLVGCKYNEKRHSKWDFSWQLINSAGEEKQNKAGKSESQQDSAEGEWGDRGWTLLLFTMGNGESADFTFVASW